MIARPLALAAALLLFACRPSTQPASAPSANSAVDTRVPSDDGVPIHYVVEGSGPTIVLLHCLGCNLHYWDSAAAELQRDHRVVRLDYGGDGSSGSARKTWGLDRFVADVRAVIDAAHVDRFTLVGHSMSGPVGLEVASELGDRVVGFVPVDTLLDADERVSEEERAATLLRVRTHYLEFMDELLPHLMPANPNPKVLERVRADAAAKDPERTASILEWLLAYRAGDALDRLDLPIIALDSGLRPPKLDHNRAHAPQFDARIIEGTGHFLMLDKPAEFSHTLRAVIESIESGRAKPRPSTPH